MADLHVVNGNEQVPSNRTVCVIKLNGEVTSNTEFVAVTYDPVTGGHQIRFNCDAITMGVAYQMAASHFKRMYDELTPSEKAQVDSIFKSEIMRGD